MLKLSATCLLRMSKHFPRRPWETMVYQITMMIFQSPVLLFHILQFIGFKQQPYELVVLPPHMQR